MIAPELATDRLRLLPPLPDDLDAMTSLHGDPAVRGQIGLPPSSREETWHRLLRYIGHWPSVGFGHWMVRDRSTGAFLGEVGLMDSRRATTPSFEGVAEAGWAFLPAAQGSGLANEACAAMLAWADHQSIERTVAIIGPDNMASIRLAERIGFAAAGEVRYRDASILLFERALTPR